MVFVRAVADARQRLLPVGTSNISASSIIRSIRTVDPSIAGFYSDRLARLPPRRRPRSRDPKGCVGPCREPPRHPPFHHQREGARLKRLMIGLQRWFTVCNPTLNSSPSSVGGLGPIRPDRHGSILPNAERMIRTSNFCKTSEDGSTPHSKVPARASVQCI